jgi:uncharacterized protein YkwD
MNKITLQTSEVWQQQLPPSSKKYITLYVLVNIAFVFFLQAFFIGLLFFIPKNDSLAQIYEKRVNTPETTEILKLINQERKIYNLPQLQVNEQLMQAAASKAQSLIAEQYFAHTSPDGKTFSSWIKAQNYKYVRVGENLAIFFTDNEKLVKAWLDSDLHRQNILNPYYQDTGLVAIPTHYQGVSTYIVVQIFGQPQSTTLAKP